MSFSGAAFGGGAGSGGLTDAPRVTAWNTVASFGSYAEAQAAVDHLVAVGFPVREIEIVGSDLRIVEHVTGRMNATRTAVAGASSGSWIGLLIGLLVGLFTAGPAWLGLMLGGVFIGAVWGAALALAARWFSHGRHNSSSLRSVAATRYDVIAVDGMAVHARVALGFTG